jgi:hypothetical protein
MDEPVDKVDNMDLSDRVDRIDVIADLRIWAGMGACPYIPIITKDASEAQQLL